MKNKKSLFISGGVFMPQKIKIPSEIKIRIVTSYLAGKYGYYEAAKVAGVSGATFGSWVHQYKFSGPTFFTPVERKTKFPTEIKKAAVEIYLSGKESQQDICDRYHIRSHTTLQKWIKVYNSHGTFKKMTGGSSMAVGRQTIPDERIKIAEECISNRKNYGEIALKYEVSYQQVYMWVKKYSEMGKDGLQDRRGRRTGSLPSRTPEEELKAKITQLEHEKYMLQMENDFLKKLDEVERRRR
jgi:transposase